MESLSHDAEPVQPLKRVSRIKHIILQKYLLPWQRILGSRNTRLAYFDCFAGPGLYELEGKPVEGSPVIAVRSALEFLGNAPDHRLDLYLIEDDPKQVELLEANLKPLQPYPSNLQVHVRRADSRSHVPDLLEQIGRSVPSFFFVDPYGHPLPVPVLNRILRRDRTEVLINLMWFRINMDLANLLMKTRLNELFGDEDWAAQPFMTSGGRRREKAFLDFFRSRLAAKYVLPFRIRFDPEDRTGSGRTKYYLVHASNHVKAALLMKEIMWDLGDQEGTFDYSGDSQGVLISSSPTEEELEQILLQQFNGQDVSFDELRQRTWQLPFVEKQYRAVIKRLEGTRLTVCRVSSKRSGVSGLDRILFK